MKKEEKEFLLKQIITLNCCIDNIIRNLHLQESGIQNILNKQLRDIQHFFAETTK